MPFVQRARDFVNNPDARHTSNPQYPIMRDTVQYLLDNAISRDNGVSTENIISYLNQRGHNIGRETWQIDILGYLRENGIYIGSLRGGVGMFIINDREEAQAVYDSIQGRIDTEQRRLDILAGLMREVEW